MCRHTNSGNTICGIPLSSYVNRLQRKKRFRVFLCTDTKKDIIAFNETFSYMPESFYQSPERVYEGQDTREKQYQFLTFLVQQCGLHTLSAAAESRSAVIKGQGQTHVHINPARYVLLDKFDQQARHVMRQYLRDEARGGESRATATAEEEAEAEVSTPATDRSIDSMVANLGGLNLSLDTCTTGDAEEMRLLAERLQSLRAEATE